MNRSGAAPGSARAGARGRTAARRPADRVSGLLAGLLLVAGAFLGSNPAGAAGGVTSGGGVRSGGTLRMTDALGAVAGGAATSGGVTLVAGLLPSVAGVTPVTLEALTAEWSPAGQPRIRWSVSADSDPAGFLVLGALSAEGPWERLTPALLDAGVRSWDDPRPFLPGAAAPERWYRLGAISRSGDDLVWSLTVSVRPGEALPERVALPPNAPNPFRTATTVTAELPVGGPVRLLLFDASGRALATLHDGDLPAGRHAFVWNGETPSGRAASGVYWARLEAAGRVVSRQIVLRR